MFQDYVTLQNVFGSFTRSLCAQKAQHCHLTTDNCKFFIKKIPFLNLFSKQLACDWIEQMWHQLYSWSFNIVVPVLTCLTKGCGLQLSCIGRMAGYIWSPSLISLVDDSRKKRCSSSACSSVFTLTLWVQFWSEYLVLWPQLPCKMNINSFKNKRQWKDNFNFLSCSFSFVFKDNLTGNSWASTRN